MYVAPDALRRGLPTLMDADVLRKIDFLVGEKQAYQFTRPTQWHRGAYELRKFFLGEEIRHVISVGGHVVNGAILYLTLHDLREKVVELHERERIRELEHGRLAKQADAEAEEEAAVRDSATCPCENKDLLLWDVTSLVLVGDELRPENKRFQLYRMIFQYMHGYAGKGVRIRLPDCCVKYVRSLYPDPNGEYTGFKEASVVALERVRRSNRK